jgi:two-component system, OmpR family, response regulator MprA
MGKPKILVIDDDFIVLDLLRDTLVMDGFEVITASSGLEGLGQLIKEQPDLVLLDIMMPNMDGYELCQKLKQSKSTSALPIIIVSAKAQPEDIEVGMALGVDDYITKPFDLKDMDKRIRIVLKKYKVM